jgi:hypothetical protein
MVSKGVIFEQYNNTSTAELSGIDCSEVYDVHRMAIRDLTSSNRVISVESPALRSPIPNRP